MQRLVTAVSAVGLAAALAFALWPGPSAHDDVGAERDAGKASAATGQSPAGSHAPLVSSAPAAPTAALPSVPLPPVPLPPGSTATAAAAVSITVSIPPKLLVGEMNDLVIGVGANAGIGEIGLAVQFDANVLQVRAASQGAWAVDVGVNPKFAAEISAAEDRVQIRSAVAGQRVGRAGGSVAVVQFQPIAPGTTSVLITDLVVKDEGGRPMTAALSVSNLQVTVDSLPAGPTAGLSR